MRSNYDSATLPLKLFSVRLLDNTQNKRYNTHMTIDTNTVLMSLMGLITAYFAVSFVRTQLDVRSQKVTRQIDSVQEEMWRMGERIDTRISALERCCAKQEKCEKSYYNSGA